MNSKKDLIKNKILSGKGHKTHNNEVAVTLKNKTLIHDYINDNNNNEPPVKKVKKSK
jgi:hypothetical protein